MRRKRIHRQAENYCDVHGPYLNALDNGTDDLPLRRPIRIAQLRLDAVGPALYDFAGRDVRTSDDDGGAEGLVHERARTSGEAGRATPTRANARGLSRRPLRDRKIIVVLRQNCATNVPVG